MRSPALLRWSVIRPDDGRNDFDGGTAVSDADDDDDNNREPDWIIRMDDEGTFVSEAEQALLDAVRDAADALRANRVEARALGKQLEARIRAAIDDEVALDLIADSGLLRLASLEAFAAGTPLFTKDSF